MLLISDDDMVIAYHTLSASSIPVGGMGAEVARKYPKYSEGMPATLLGCLAVDSNHVGRGYGRQILMNAIERAFAATAVIGSAFLVVRAIDDEAFRFYRKYGFMPFPDDPRRLFLPMDTIAELFA